jgi:hypothetical protein
MRRGLANLGCDQYVHGPVNLLNQAAPPSGAGFDE